MYSAYFGLGDAGRARSNLADFLLVLHSKIPEIEILQHTQPSLSRSLSLSLPLPSSSFLLSILPLFITLSREAVRRRCGSE